MRRVRESQTIVVYTYYVKRKVLTLKSNPLNSINDQRRIVQVVPTMKHETNTMKQHINTTTLIDNVTSIDRLVHLSPAELQTHTKTAASQFASFAAKGCKYLGLLRSRLHAAGSSTEDSYKLISKEMTKAGFDTKQAKSAVNNGLGHSKLAEFLVREDGGKPIDEARFYAVPVSAAALVATTLKKGGAEAIDQFNSIPLRKGKLNRKSLAEFLPSKSEGEAVDKAAAAAASDAVEGAEVSASEEVAAELSPIEVAAKGIALLTKALPNLKSNELDSVKTELAKLGL